MPQFDGSQMRIGGEILDAVSLSPSTQSTVEVGGSYVDMDRDLVLSFQSDRTGKVCVSCSFYIEKTTSNSSSEIRLRLLDQYDSVILGTIKDCVLLPEPSSGQYISFSWILDVSLGTSYVCKPQIVRNSSTETIKLLYGGTKPSLFIQVVGL